MKNLAVSRRYAKALILIGKENDQAEHYRAELESVVSLFDTHPNLETALVNPLFNKNDRKQVLSSVLGKSDFSDITKSFLVLLFEKGRIGYIREISSLYNEFVDELNGVVKASVVSATKLSSKAVEKIKEALSKKTGKSIVLNVEQDTGLIGGVVTKIGDLVLDGSVQTQLINMGETLKKGERV